MGHALLKKAILLLKMATVRFILNTAVCSKQDLKSLILVLISYWAFQIIFEQFMGFLLEENRVIGGSSVKQLRYTM